MFEGNPFEFFSPHFVQVLYSMILYHPILLLLLKYTYRYIFFHLFHRSIHSCIHRNIIELKRYAKSHERTKMGERTIPFCVKRQVVRRPSRMNFARRFALPNRPVHTLYIKYFVSSCNFSSSSHPFRSTFLSYSLSRLYFFRSSFFFAIPRRYGKKAKRTAKKKKEKKGKNQ